MRTIDQMHELVATNARKIYNKDHHHIPLFIIDFKKPTDVLGGKPIDLAITPFDWRTVEDRDRMAISMRALCGMGLVQNIAFVHEVWMVQGKTEEVDTSIPPSENPDRFFVLFLSIESVDGDRRLGYWRIIEADTKRARLGEYEEQPPHAGVTGRFANMFGRQKAMSGKLS